MQECGQKSMTSWWLCNFKLISQWQINWTISNIYIFEYFNGLLCQLEKLQQNQNRKKLCTHKSAQSDVYSAAFIKFNRYTEEQLQSCKWNLHEWYLAIYGVHIIRWVFRNIDMCLDTYKCINIHALSCPQQIKKTQLKSKSWICLQNSMQ